MGTSEKKDIKGYNNGSFKSLLGQNWIFEKSENQWVKDVYQQIKGQHKLSETCETKWKQNNKKYITNT